MKGLELPINVMIVVVLAIIVLIAIMALFMGVWGPGSENVNLAAVKNGACQKYVSLNYCDGTNDGSSISSTTITCTCAETNIILTDDVGIGRDGKDDGTDAHDNTETEPFTITNLKDIASCCYSSNANKLCCF